MALLTKYRPTAKEYSKNALSVSHGMMNELHSAKKLVESGNITRETAIKNVRHCAAFALNKLLTQSADMNKLTADIHGLLMRMEVHNASDVLQGTKELLDIAQEVSLEMATTLRAVRANWELYEDQMAIWLKDIQMGLK